MSRGYRLFDSNEPMPEPTVEHPDYWITHDTDWYLSPGELEDSEELWELPEDLYEESSLWSAEDALDYPDPE